MLDLDEYINNATEMKINGVIYHVKQPTVAMIAKMDAIQAKVTEKNMVDKRVETALLILNNNEEKKEFVADDMQKWTQEAIAKVISVMAMLRYEVESDPN